MMQWTRTSTGEFRGPVHHAESSALCIPTAIYPFPGGLSMASRFISESTANPTCELGWQSLGVPLRQAVQQVSTLAVWLPPPDVEAYL